LILSADNNSETQEKIFSYAESASRSSSASSISRTPALTIASTDSETRSTICDQGPAYYPAPLFSEQWSHINESEFSCPSSLALSRQMLDLTDSKRKTQLLGSDPDRAFSPASSSYSRSSRWSASSTWSMPAVPPQEWVTQERNAKGDTEPERAERTPVHISRLECQKKSTVRSRVRKLNELMEQRASMSRNHEQIAEQWPPRFVNPGGDGQGVALFGSQISSTRLPSYQHFAAAFGENQPRLIAPPPEPQPIGQHASSSTLHSSGRIHRQRGHQNTKPSEYFRISKDRSKVRLSSSPVALQVHAL
jgi:hypothetical protein